MTHFWIQGYAFLPIFHRLPPIASDGLQIPPWQTSSQKAISFRSYRRLADLATNRHLSRTGDLARAAELRYGVQTQFRTELEAANARLADLQKDLRMLKEEVEEEDIAEVVSRWTGIPVSRMLESEKEKLLKMEDRLRLRVVGQEEAVTAVSEAVRRSRAGLQAPHRPIGSFAAPGIGRPPGGRRQRCGAARGGQERA